MQVPYDRVLTTSILAEASSELSFCYCRASISSVGSLSIFAGFAGSVTSLSVIFLLLHHIVCFPFRLSNRFFCTIRRAGTFARDILSVFARWCFPFGHPGLAIS